jgi:hypothetical protein
MSIVLHASLAAVAIVMARGHQVTLPPVYQVDLVARQPPAAIGQVSNSLPPSAARADAPSQACRGADTVGRPGQARSEEGRASGDARA